MLSRIADSLFWLNRYMERSDCLLRVIRTHYILSFDADQSAGFSWKEVLDLFYASFRCIRIGKNKFRSRRIKIFDR